MPDQANTAMPAQRRSVLSQTQRRLLTACAASTAVIATAYWIHQRHTHVFTDDSHIAARMIEVSTRTAGEIVTFTVAQGDRLHPGALIAQIDDRTARFTLDELNAHLKSTQAACERLEVQIDMVDRESGGKLRAAKSQLDATLASMASAQSDLEFKRNEWERAQSMLKRKMIPLQQWENTRNAYQQSEQVLLRTRAESESARAAVFEAEAGQTQIRVLASELRGLRFESDRVLASIEKQKVVIDDLRVLSSSRGLVDETFVHEGEYVVPGQRLLLMHDPDNIWIDASIKETEIRHVQPGYGVAIKVDAYPDRTFNGKVLRVGQSATSQFSLLPNTNPSGNFTKVTQRLPVKISIQQADGLLRPGMMVEVAIANH